MTDSAVIPGNDEFLAVALHWLRLRLAAHAVKARVEVLPREGPAADPSGLANPSARADTPHARRWRRPATATVPPSAVPASAPALPPGPEATGDVDAAEAIAAAAVAEAAGQDPPPRLVRLGQLLGLSPFERYTLLLCAAMELDPTFAGRCAEAQGDPHLAYPTFALALGALPGEAWDVVSAHRPLRRLRLIEIHQPAGVPLLTSRLRADERVVNFIKGLNELDDRLEPLLAPVAPDPVPLPGSQLAAIEAITSWWIESERYGPGHLVQLLGPDETSKRLVAAEVAKRLGLRLYRLPDRSLPRQPADLETLARLWSRERQLLDAALYLVAPDRPGENVPSLVARTEGLRFLAVDEPWRDLEVPSLLVDVARPTRAEQRQAWLTELGPGDEPAADTLAGQFDLNVNTIRDATDRVGPDPGRLERLWGACLARPRPRLDALAQRLEPKATWDDLVLPDSRAERCSRQIAAPGRARRSTVYDDWGFAERMNRGPRHQRAVRRPERHRQDDGRRGARQRAAARPLPHRPVGGGEQVHRRDREEPAPAVRRGRGRRRDPASSTRPTRCSASAARSRTATTATRTSRSTTCCSGWRAYRGLAILATNMKQRARPGVPAPAAVRRRRSRSPAPPSAGRSGRGCSRRGRPRARSIWTGWPRLPADRRQHPQHRAQRRVPRRRTRAPGHHADRPGRRARRVPQARDPVPRQRLPVRGARWTSTCTSNGSSSTPRCWRPTGVRPCRRP